MAEQTELYLTDRHIWNKTWHMTVATSAVKTETWNRIYYSCWVAQMTHHFFFKLFNKHFTAYARHLYGYDAKILCPDSDLKLASSE